MNRQKRCQAKGVPPAIVVKDENNELVEMETVTSCILLGANIGQELTWWAHLVTGEKPLLPSLRKQVGILAHLSKNIPMNSRRILAEG